MMRSIVRLLAAGACIAGLAQPAPAAEQAAGAGSAEQRGDAWSKLRAYSADKRDEALAYGRQLMTEADAKAARLEAEASRMSGEAKLRYDRQMEDLETTRADAAAQLEKMEQAGAGAWNEAKAGFADAYRDLQRAYRRAVKQIK